MPVQKTTSKREALGSNVVPINYNLVFEPDLKTFKFKCTEKLTVKINRSVKSIVLNSAELEIKKASISQGGKNMAAKVSENLETQRITLDGGSTLSGEVVIEIEAIGTHNDGMHGFYRSTYSHEGKDGVIVSTQFEQTDARKAFPCFDEPALKATFDVTLVVDKDLSAVSNMPIKSESAVGKGKKAVQFLTTPKMSSYLLYLGAGKFEFTQEKFGGILYRVITVPGKSGYTRLAMDFAKKFLPFYETYFEIKYPLPKIDLLAIPDFAAGAMENWGAMTYREISLLGDEKKTALVAKERIAEVVAHELAHQWFGDLVTMEWWDDLWLNESFANLMEDWSRNKIYPQWRLFEQRALADIPSAMADDQLKSTHPINVEINKPAEASAIFDNISYIKGGSVLWMINDYVGEENFRKGLSIYLNRHAYSNARKEDLWNAIAQAGGKEAKELPRIAKFWIDEPGYPIVRVSGPDSSGNVELRQERFLMLGSEEGKVWPIPIRYTTDKGPGFLLMDSKEARISVKGSSFIKLNLGMKGFYRVSYDDTNLHSLGSGISKGKISPLDGWGVETDLLATARKGEIKVNMVLDFIEKYCIGIGYPLNMGISGHLESLYLRFSANKKLAERIRRISTAHNYKLLQELGWEKRPQDTSIDIKLRQTAISCLGANAHPEVVKKSRELFAAYLKDGKEIDPDLKTSVYMTVATNGDPKTFEQLLGLYKKAIMPDEKQRLLVSLGKFRNKELLIKALEFGVSKNTRIQDWFVIPMVASSNPVGKGMMLKWTEQNWKKLLTTFEPGTLMLPRYLENLGVLDTPEDKEEIARFFGMRENRRVDTERSLGNTLEQMQININFIKANQ